MKITLITATFNSLQFISNVLASIKQQTYQNIEHILVDGESVDGTVEYLQQSNQVSRIITEPDNGIYDALNKGIKLSTGDVIGFLHSDDAFFLDGTLAKIAKVFNTPTGKSGKFPDVVYGDLILIDQKDTDKVVRYWKSQPFRPTLLNRGWMPPHPTIFMRREVYEKHGFFNIDLKCSADYDYILRVFRDPTLNIAYLPEVITKMRVGGVSTKGIKNLINKKKEDYWVLKNNHMPFPLWILLAKNLSKIPQLIFKKR